MKNAQTRLARTSIIAIAAALLTVGAACDREDSAPAEQPSGAQPPTAADRAPERKPEDPASMEARAKALEKARIEAEAKQNAEAKRPTGRPAADRKPAQAKPDPDRRPSAPSTRRNPSAPTGQNFTDDEIEEFVEIAPEMRSLQKDVRNKLSEAESAEEAKVIQQRARRQMAKLFEKSELEPNQYAAIAKRMSDDPSFRERINGASGQ